MRTLFLLGMLPVAAWWTLDTLGWGPDAQVISGTLDPADPTASAVRGLLYVATWLVAVTIGPPLVGGSGLWWLWRRAGQGSDAPTRTVGGWAKRSSTSGSRPSPTRSR